MENLSHYLKKMVNIFCDDIINLFWENRQEEFYVESVTFDLI